MIDNKIYTGMLRSVEGKNFLELDNGKKAFNDELIWNGYIKHWENTKVNARRLIQTDYKNGDPIIIMWPYVPKPDVSFVQIYYNERLVKYFDSLMGHLAINVNSKIFNFAKKINENEVMTKEEYFYRPALGEFAPSPRNGKQEINVDGRPYYDKFGRNFMRSIHVLHIEGINTEKLYDILKEELEIIHNTPEKPDDPGNYPDFHFINRSCTTIIRDGLRKYGFTNIKGVIPRDFFVNAAYNFQKEKDITLRIFKMPQLLVRECPQSKPTMLFNIKNWFWVRTLKFEN